jgi:hypothetical protein
MGPRRRRTGAAHALLQSADGAALLGSHLSWPTPLASERGRHNTHAHAHTRVHTHTHSHTHARGTHASLEHAPFQAYAPVGTPRPLRPRKHTRARVMQEPGAARVPRALRARVDAGPPPAMRGMGAVCGPRSPGPKRAVEEGAGPPGSGVWLCRSLRACTPAQQGLPNRGQMRWREKGSGATKQAPVRGRTNTALASRRKGGAAARPAIGPPREAAAKTWYRCPGAAQRDHSGAPREGRTRSVLSHNQAAAARKLAGQLGFTLCMTGNNCLPIARFIISAGARQRRAGSTAQERL